LSSEIQSWSAGTRYSRAKLRDRLDDGGNVLLLNVQAIVAITVGANADETIKVSKLFFPKRLTLSFEIMFGRPITGSKPELQGRVLETCAKLIDDKLFQRIDTQTFKGLTLENVNKALAIQESSAAIGKTCHRALTVANDGCRHWLIKCMIGYFIVSKGKRLVDARGRSLRFRRNRR
jgi:hypothetical protein